MPEIRILMVDDHSLFRESLGRFLEIEPEVRVVGKCATIAETLETIDRTEVDVILLDYDLGDEHGLDLLTELKRRGSGARALMVTAGVSDDTAVRVMEAGAAGIFQKRDNTEQLLTAIRQVASGAIWLDDAALQSLLAGRHERAGMAERARPLTQRQRQVLRGILDGLANKEIGWRLKISETAVKAVVQELFHKAGVRTRSQLVRIAIEQHMNDWLAPAAVKRP